MFDTIARTSRPATPLAISMAVHMALVASVVIPALFVIEDLPELPTTMVFAAPASVAPPPPPPPPSPVPVKPQPARQASPVRPDAAPIEAPAAITPESGFERADPGVPGGIEGGMPGGVPGGIVGGIAEMPLPPPPAPAPVPRKPVRVGGDIKEPAVVVRVPPTYPDIAARAQIHGLVILEALVDEQGVVQAVKVLRSVKFLDQSAIDALKQWRYTPLTVNGEALPFVLTVSLNFRLDSTDAAR